MKTKILTIILIALSIIMLTSTVKANYQSNNGSKVQVRPYEWIGNIRRMEADGQVMGLTEEIDSTTLEATTGSNNIDVHMVKNTEWGAMAILSASTEYGKQSSSTDTTDKKVSRYVYNGSAGLKTTTGNVYGIYISGESSWTAAGTNDFASRSIGSKYINRYSENELKSGDGLLIWHEKQTSSIANTDSGTNGYKRGYRGVFTYVWSASTASNHYGRTFACLVTGQGV